MTHLEFFMIVPQSESEPTPVGDLTTRDSAPPGESSAEGIAPEPTRSGAKRRGGKKKRDGGKKQGRTKVPVTADAVRANVHLALDVAARQAHRRDAFKRLLDVARRDWALTAAVLGDTGSDESMPEDLAWLASELAYDASVLDATEGRSPESVVTIVAALAPVIVRLARSWWISGKRLVDDALTTAPRRRTRLPEPPYDPWLDEHPLLETDAEGRWPSPSERRAEPPEPLPVSPEMVERCADLGAPMARELRARRQLLSLRAGGAEMEPAELRALTAGRAILESVVRVTESTFDDTPEARLDHASRLAIAGFVGRVPDVWAMLDKSRATLLRAGPADRAAADRWAELVALTYAKTRRATEAVADVPDVALPALLAAAARHDRKALVERGQNVVMERVNHGRATDALWPGLLALADESPGLRRWITAYMAPHAPAGVTGTKASAEETLVLAQARTAPLDDVVAARFLDRVRGIDAGMRVVVLLSIARRVDDELPDRERRYSSAAVARLQRLSVELAGRRTRIGDLLGGVPSSIDEPLQRADEAIRSAIDVLREREERTPGTRERRDPIVISEEPELGDPESALRKLTFDPLRDEGSSRRLRTAVQGRLAWLAVHRPAALSPLASGEATSFPEAAGAAWEVGVERRSEPLLASLDRSFGTLPWAERVWTDVLLSTDRLDDPLPLSASVAARTGELLEGYIVTMRGRLAAPDRMGEVARVVEEAEKATVGALHHVSSIASRLTALVDPT